MDGRTKVSTWKSDDPTSPLRLDVYVNGNGYFEADLPVEDGDTVVVSAQTLASLDKSLRAAILRNKKPMDVPGTVIHPRLGVSAKATLIGIHRGTRKGRFRLTDSGKMLEWETGYGVAGQDQWDDRTLFVPDNVPAEQLDELVAACQSVAVVEQDLRTVCKRRDELAEQLSVSGGEMSGGGYGRLDAAELVLVETRLEATLKNLPELAELAE